MGNFRWDGGAKRKFLDESLPTDSAVIDFQIYFRIFDGLILVLSLGCDTLSRHLSRQSTSRFHRPPRQTSFYRAVFSQMS